MESDSRNISNFRYGGPARMDRLDQFTTSQHSSFMSQPRMQTVLSEGANPLDLTSAIVHELQRTNQPAWLPLNHQLGGSGSGSQSSHEPANGLQLPYGSFLSHQNLNAGDNTCPLIPQYIPRFDEALGPAVQQMPTRLGYTLESESLASAHQGFYSRSTNGLPRDTAPRIPLHSGQQVLDTATRVDQPMRYCSPWVERMMQADVTPTPSPSLSTSLSLAQRAGGDVSCVASQTLDFQSCHSTDMQRSEKSMRSALSGDLQRESTLEASADLCTDDEDLDTRPIDVKRKKRMLSNRASAQRSRQRRQERLDQLEVLTAQLRVENSTLQKKLSAAIQVAKKFEDQNKNLLKKVERLGKELEGGKPRIPVAAFDESVSSQQTTCASSCEMVGGRISIDPNQMRDGDINDGASTPSMSAGSPGWPSGTNNTENERETDLASNGNKGEAINTIRKSFSACRMGKKRTFDQSEAAAASFGGSESTSIGNHMGSGSGGYMTSSQPSRPRLSLPTTRIGGESSSFLEPRTLHNSFGLDPSFKDDSNGMDCLETDRWLEFAECFK